MTDNGPGGHPESTTEVMLHAAYALSRHLPWNLGNAIHAIVRDDLRNARAALDDEIERRYPEPDQPEETAHD